MIGKRGQRLGCRAAKASEASLSGAAAKTLSAAGPVVAAYCRQTTGSEGSALSSIARRTHSSCVQVPQLSHQELCETYFPMSSALALEAYAVAYECLPDKSLSPLPLDLSIAPDAPHQPVLGIAQRNDSQWRRFGTVNLCWWSLCQRLVWSHMIVGSGPTACAPLLRTTIRRSRSCCFGLEYPVHLFVCPILFGMPRSNELDANSQSGPPSAQTRKPKRPGRSKGLAVVYSNNLRVAMLPKQPDKNPSYRLPTLVAQQPNSQQVTAEQIPHCQRLDPPAIHSSKPAFEIHRPDVIASGGWCQTIAPQLWTTPRTSAAGSVELHSLEPVANRARRRRALPPINSTQPSRQFSAPPTSVASPYPANPLHPHRRGLPRRALGARASTSKPATPFALETSRPLIASLATDSEDLTQPRHASLGLQSQLHELQPLCQTRDFFPRHDRGKGPK